MEKFRSFVFVLFLLLLMFGVLNSGCAISIKTQPWLNALNNQKNPSSSQSQLEENLVNRDWKGSNGRFFELIEENSGTYLAARSDQFSSYQEAKEILTREFLAHFPNYCSKCGVKVSVRTVSGFYELSLDHSYRTSGKNGRQEYLSRADFLH